ncbi:MULTISPECIES: glycoside hydrolase family 19 protein [unclassified Streptomyces]|uniref:glycoside hydrolase family 19 protein n=1 Tax=unclassified Streptomyces TaxID=2593676 RepID=UPI0033A90E43
MLRKLLTLFAALCTAVGLAVLLPAASAGAAPACVAAWNSSTVYTGGKTASYNGHNWYAKWWTQNERPGSSDVWRDEGACGTGGGGDGGQNNGFVVSEAQFNQMFPNRNPFYTYAGLVNALKSYPAFATTGSDTVKKQEAAAFLANVSHETAGLYYIVEQNTANYPHYCDSGQPYGCPAGQAAYYGRGPIQLSWNFNYKAAGDALGIDLLNNPWRVEQDPAVAMSTGLWYWNTQNGPGTMTGHNAMVNGAGFGQTIRSINGSLECDGKNPAQVQSRVSKYQQFTQILGVPTGANLSC